MKKKKGGGGGIVLMQRKVGKIVNLGRTTIWIHRLMLVKSGRAHTLGGGMYKKFDEQGRLHITLPKNGKEKKGGGRREGESNY